MAFFESLHDDILLSIVDALESKHDTPFQFRHSIILFSCISRRTRRLCLPVIFKNCNINDYRRFLPPRAVWVYLQIMELNLSPNPADFYPNLRLLLPHLPHLHRILIVRCDGGITTELLQIIFSAPALADLEIEDCCIDNLDPCLDDIVPVHAPIRRLVYTAPFRFDGITSVEQLELEAALLTTLLEHFHTTLEVLQIPSETAQISFMASLSWPSLQRLTLFGICPVLRVPLVTLLQLMPQLRSLKLAFGYFPHHLPRIQIWPPDIPATLDLPFLDDLLISYPHPSDRLFEIIPIGLRRLSLKDIPHVFFRFFGIAHPLPTCEELLQILRTCQISTLEHLELGYVMDSFDQQKNLFSFIGGSCPRLVSVELHCCLPSNDSGKTDLVPNIASAVSCIKSLKTLRLYFDLPNNEFPPEMSSSLGKENLSRIVEYSKEIATVVPWLDTISILHKAHEYNSWVISDIQHEENGSISLGRYIPVPDMMRWC